MLKLVCCRNPFLGLLELAAVTISLVTALKQNAHHHEHLHDKKHEHPKFKKSANK